MNTTEVPSKPDTFLILSMAIDINELNIDLKSLVRRCYFTVYSLLITILSVVEKIRTQTMFTESENNF